MLGIQSFRIWVPAFAGTNGPGRPLASLRGARRRKGDRLDLGQVELAGGMIDIESDNFTVGIEVDHETCDDLSGLGARCALEFDIKAVRFRIVVQLHHSSSRKLRSKNALWTVSPSSNVTTRRNRGRVSPGMIILPQKRIRRSFWIS